MLLEKVRRAGGSVFGSNWALVEKGWRRWQNGKGETLDWRKAKSIGRNAGCML